MCNVMVIRQSGTPMGVISALGTLRTPELRNLWPDLLQIKFIGMVLACRCVTSWSFAHKGHMAVPMGVIGTLGTLRMPDLRNHWADSLKIKLIGTVLACRSATSWSFAHWGYMGVPTGVKPYRHWNSATTGRIHSKLSSLESSWPVDV